MKSIAGQRSGAESKEASGNARVQVGQVEVIGLTDVLVPFPMPLPQMFPTVPAEAWPTFRQLYPSAFSGPDTWLVRISCYLIRRPGRTILVDTGLGPASTALAQFVQTSGQLLDRLHAEGVRPEDVDTVLLTHLHPDHVGWNVQHEGGSPRPTFPQAQYLAHQADWDMAEQLLASDPARAVHVRENVIPLQQMGCLSLLTRDFDLADGIRVLPTPGHTPGHLSIRIEAGGDTSLWLLGDAVAHPLQIDEPSHSYALDVDAQVARETRFQLLERIVAEGSIMTACHLPEPGFGRVVQQGQERGWRPV